MKLILLKLSFRTGFSREESALYGPRRYGRPRPYSGAQRRGMRPSPYHSEWTSVAKNLIILLMILVASTQFVFGQEQSSTYKIRSNDWLKVTVWKEPELGGTVFVQPEGTIALPVVGEIHAAGLTLDELQHQITTNLVRYVADPRVKVILGKAPSLKFEYNILPDTWPQA